MLRILLLTIAAFVVSVTSTTVQDSTPKKLSYGIRQIDQILDDRPEMQNAIDPSHPLMKWIAERFEAGDRGQRIVWDHREPLSGQPAEHVGAYDSYFPQIRVTASDDYTGRDKWVFVIFELMNIEGDSKQDLLLDDLVHGRLNSEQYGLRCTEVEHQAMVKTIHLLLDLNICSCLKPEDQGVLEILVTRQNFEEYVQLLDSISEDEYDPRRYYAEHGESVLKSLAVSRENQGDGHGVQQQDGRSTETNRGTGIIDPDSLIELD